VRSLAAALLLGAALLSAAAARAGTPSEDPQRLYLRGLLQERFGDPERALADYERVLALDPASDFVHEALASLALRLGRTDRALAEAETVLRLAPDRPHSHLVMGRVRLARAELEEAGAAFDRALAIDPDDDEALLYAAHIRAVGRPAEAIAYYQRFLQNNPQSIEALARTAELQERVGDLSAAHDTWAQIIEQDPSDFAAHLAMAHVYEVTGDTVSAVAEYETCRFLDTQNVGVLLRLGELYYRQGDGDRAREAFAQAERIQPDDPSVNFWLSLLAEERHDWEEAARRLAAVARVGRDPQVLLRLAYYESQAGHGDRALRRLTELHKSDPDNTDYLYYLALGYEDADRPRAAVRRLEKVVKLDPARAEAWFHLGLNWDALGRFDRAEPHLVRAVELNPTDSVALNYLGYSWADRGVNLEKAREHIEKAVAIEPDNGAYLDSLGWVFHKLGRGEEAVDALENAARLTRDAVVWLHLGDALEKVGRVEDARRAWEEGVLLDPRNAALRRRAGRLTGRVLPDSAPRRLLKHVEGNFRQLRSLAGYADIDGGRDGRAFRARGVFYYARPDLFRFEFLGPFFVPQALLVQNAEGRRWLPDRAAAGAALSDGEDADVGRWLAALSAFLSGDVAAAFDDPSVHVVSERGRVRYTGPRGELEADAETRVVTALELSDPDGGTARFRFDGYSEVEGLWVPSRVECELPDTGFRLTVELRGLKVNTLGQEDPLFHPPAAGGPPR
jgi:tetratricopeptide (TPR) repeat protein